MHDVLTEINTFGRITLSDQYRAIDVNQVCNKLNTELKPETITKLIELYYLFRTYLLAIDINKFVNTTCSFNLHPIQFDLVSFVSSKIELPDELKEVIRNVEYILNHPHEVVKNISQAYSITKVSITPSKYRLMSDSANELEQLLQMALHEVFYILRTMVKTSSKHMNMINQRYEENLLAFIQKYLPYQFYHNVIDVAECIDLYVRCIDFGQVIDETIKLHPTSFAFNSQQFITQQLQRMMSSDEQKPDQNAFINSVLHKLSNVFACIDYAFQHPQTTLDNIRALVIDDEDIF